VDDKLYQFQVEGADWLATQDHALLADEPGLGKSAQVVVAADIIDAKTILIIPPAGVRIGWRNQVEKWTTWGHNINLCTTSDCLPMKNAVNIINYDLPGRGFIRSAKRPNAWLQRWLDFNWDLTVPDEAHKLKEEEALRTLAIFGNEHHEGLIHRSKRLWLLTGTPMPNHPGELFTLMRALRNNPEGHTQLTWNKKFCLLKTTGFATGKPYAARQETTTELNQLLKKVMMRRYKAVVLPQLPKLRVDDYPLPQVTIKLEEFFEDAIINKKGVEQKIHEQEDFVRQARNRMLASGGEWTTMDFVGLLEEMEGGVSLYRRWLGAVKAASMIDEVFDELESGSIKKIMLICYHKQVMQFLERRLKQFGVFTIDGGVSMPKRQQMITNFCEEGGPRVGIGQIVAMGEGTDGLQHCCHEMIIVEPAWSPYLNAQALCRLHRIPQRMPVRGRMARLADTLDDYISEVVTRKTRDIALIVDG
jgi:SWI/SNF-related matrix-associated actin-dependent regulator 1 of chromatin subfamily A